MEYSSWNCCISISQVNQNRSVSVKLWNRPFFIRNMLFMKQMSESEKIDKTLIQTSVSQQKQMTETDISQNWSKTWLVSEGPNTSVSDSDFFLTLYWNILKWNVVQKHELFQRCEYFRNTLFQCNVFQVYPSETVLWIRRYATCVE